MSFRVPVLETFSWQLPILSVITALPVSPVKGDRYLVSSETASLDVALTGKENNIVWYDGESWIYDQPKLGWTVFNINASSQLNFIRDPVNDVYQWVNLSGGGAEGLTLSGDINSASANVNWLLKDNDQHALDLKVAGDSGNITLINVDTTDDAETVNFNSDVNVNGDLQVNGTLTYVNTTTLQVNDALVELNKGGNTTTAKASGAGFTVLDHVDAVGTEGEDDYVAAHDEEIAYIKTTIAGTDSLPTLHVKPTDATSEFNFKIDSGVDTDINIFLKQNTQNQLGPLNAVTNNIILDQSLSTDDNVKFDALTVTSESNLLGIAKVGEFNGSGTVADPYAPVIGSEADLLVSGGLKVFNDAEFKNDAKVNGTLIADQNAVVGFNLTVGQDALIQGDAKIYGALKNPDGTKAVTVDNLDTAYKSRAQYDEDLECLVFDTVNMDHIKSIKKPRVVSSIPAKGNINVAVGSSVVLQLNKDVELDELDNTKVELATTAGDAVTATVTFDGSSDAVNGGYVNTVTITPSADLDYDTSYKVTIDAGAYAYHDDNTVVNDADTNAVTFTTGKDLGVLTILRSVPANNSSNVDPAGSIEIEYNYPIQAGTGTIEFREIV